MPIYIDIEEIIKKGPAQTSTFISSDYADGYNYLFGELCKQKVEDVEPVRHGKWIFNTDDFVPKYRCSICGYNRPIMAGENVKQEPSNFCNTCGAKMDLEG